MAKILFIAAYPTPDKHKEGMFQRIKAIDMEFEAYDRTYLSISLSSYFRKKEFVIGNVKVICANWFLHLGYIRRIIKGSCYIYVHSLYNFKYLVGMSLNNENITLDIHGCVPEELEFYGKKMKATVYNWIERKAINHISNLIAVSYTMVDYYRNKYELDTHIRCFVKPIFPINNIHRIAPETLNNLRESLNIRDTDVVFTYSGNLQKWQNFDLMLQIIGSMSNPCYKFLILTKDKEDAELATSKLPNAKSVIVKSVEPKELGGYYAMSHYGFILRDDITLNNVAAPTKLIEYLSYGLIPIVKSINIGDSVRMGYEYISYNDDLNNLPCRKSVVNERVAAAVFKQNTDNSIPDILF